MWMSFTDRHCVAAGLAGMVEVARGEEVLDIVLAVWTFHDALLAIANNGLADLIRHVDVGYLALAAHNPLFPRYEGTLCR